MRRSRAPRALRGLIGASVATFIALLSHVAGGGAMPGWIGIAVPWVLSVMVCTLLAGRALSLWRLALAVTISQLLFHTLFVLGFVASGLSTGGQSAHAGPGSHSAQLLMPLPAAAVSALPPDATMLLWHGFAAVVTVAALYRGERALLKLREFATALVAWAARTLATFDAPVLLPAARTRATGLSPRPLGAGPALSSLQRRGPPLCA